MKGRQEAAQPLNPGKQLRPTRSPVSAPLPGRHSQKPSAQENVVQTDRSGPDKEPKTAMDARQKSLKLTHARFRPLDKRDIPLYTGTV
jgi:hypothetical protein